MMSDGLCAGEGGFKGFALSLDCPDTTTAGEAFAALADGGQLMMPLRKTFWAPLFGMVTDRFGVGVAGRRVPRRRVTSERCELGAATRPP